MGIVNAVLTQDTDVGTSPSCQPAHKARAWSRLINYLGEMLCGPQVEMPDSRDGRMTPCQYFTPPQMRIAAIIYVGSPGYREISFWECWQQTWRTNRSSYPARRGDVRPPLPDPQWAVDYYHTVNYLKAHRPS